LLLSGQEAELSGPLEQPGWAPFALLAEQPISGKLEKRVESVASP
jgi:hypothetical protein